MQSDNGIYNMLSILNMLIILMDYPILGERADHQLPWLISLRRSISISWRHQNQGYVFAFWHLILAHFFCFLYWRWFSESDF